jgi:DNA-binding transcriptional MerR regulator
MDMWTIGVLAERAGVGVETIRYYERRGLLAAPPRTRAGYRLYREHDVWRVEFIRRAKDLGFTLAEIGDLFGPDDHRTSDEVLDAARAKLAAVDDAILSLHEQRCRLRQLVDLCRHGDTEACTSLLVGASS